MLYKCIIVNRTNNELILCMACTGGARTEGFYKISNNEKAGYLRHARGVQETWDADSIGPRLVFVSRVLPPGGYTCVCHIWLCARQGWGSNTCI